MTLVVLVMVVDDLENIGSMDTDCDANLASASSEPLEKQLPVFRG